MTVVLAGLICIASLVTVKSFAVSAPAKRNPSMADNSQQNKKTLLTSDQVMKLSLEQKNKYFQQLRKLMESMEAVEHSFQASKTTGNHSSRNFQKLIFLAEQAWAANTNNQGVQKGEKCIIAGWISIVAADKKGRLSCGVGDQNVSSKCTAGSVQCNPVLYMPSSGSKLCVKLGANSTRQCNELSTAIPTFNNMSEYQAFSKKADDHISEIHDVCKKFNPNPIDVKNNTSPSGKISSDQKSTCENYFQMRERINEWGCGSDGSAGNANVQQNKAWCQSQPAPAAASCKVTLPDESTKAERTFSINSGNDEIKLTRDSFADVKFIPQKNEGFWGNVPYTPSASVKDGADGFYSKLENGKYRLAFRDDKNKWHTSEVTLKADGSCDKPVFKPVDPLSEMAKQGDPAAREFLSPESWAKSTCEANSEYFKKCNVSGNDPKDDDLVNIDSMLTDDKGNYYVASDFYDDSSKKRDTHVLQVTRGGMKLQKMENKGENEFKTKGFWGAFKKARSLHPVDMEKLKRENPWIVNTARNKCAYKKSLTDMYEKLDEKNYPALNSGADEPKGRCEVFDKRLEQIQKDNAATFNGAN